MLLTRLIYHPSELALLPNPLEWLSNPLLPPHSQTIQYRSPSVTDTLSKLHQLCATSPLQTCRSFRLFLTESPRGFV